jgi:TfoX/Sxy family transcriptional regulator of competence genes
MATNSSTIEYILDHLGDERCFHARAMFGEYALYAHKRVVALVCDDLLYVKVRPESVALADVCELGAPYPGAKPHYIVTEDHLATLEDLPNILRAIARGL